MSGSALSASLEELEDELMFNQILLSSLDPAISENHDAEKRRLESVVRSIEERIEERRGVVPPAQGPSSLPPTNLLSPPNLGSKKRSRDSSYLSPPTASGSSSSKSRRLGTESGPTDSRRGSTATTSSEDSLLVAEKQFEQKTGKSVSRGVQEAIERQKQRAKEIERLAEQQRQDREIARQLERGNGSGGSSFSNHAAAAQQSGPSSSQNWLQEHAKARKAAVQGQQQRNEENTSRERDRHVAVEAWRSGVPGAGPTLSTPNGPLNTYHPGLKAGLGLSPRSDSATNSVLQPSHNSGNIQLVDRSRVKTEPRVDRTSTSTTSQPLIPNDDDDLQEISPEAFSTGVRRNDVRPPSYLGGYLPSIQSLQLPPYGAPVSTTMPGQWPGSSAYAGQVQYQNPSNTMRNSGPPYNPYGGRIIPPALSAALKSERDAGPSSLMHTGGYSGSDRIFDLAQAQVESGMYSRYPGFDDDDDDYDNRYGYLDRMQGHLDPEQQREEMNKLLENIKDDGNVPKELREQTPQGMKMELMEHQRIGLAWLKGMEAGTNKGGILADDMGLGKTIQAMALMLARRSEDSRCKTNLVVAPVALMRQWEREIKTKIRPGRDALSVKIHHGANKKATYQQLKQFDVVLTTYGTLAAEFKRKEALELKIRGDPATADRERAKVSLPLLGDQSKWHRVILDEAQCIKNKQTRTSLAACHLTATYRLCMTGTPMMNNVDELYSLVRFLRIPPYSNHDRFRKDFTNPLKSMHGHSKQEAMTKLQALLKAVLLRRTKKSMIDGRPILEDLPERSTEVAEVVFDDDQMAVYKSLETSTQLRFNRYLKANTVGKNYSNMLVLLLRLRQACCHPHLIKDFSKEVQVEGVSRDEMAEMAKTLQPAVVDRIKEAEGAFDCPVCMDGTPNPAIFIPCGHHTCDECYKQLSNEQYVMERGKDSAECPQCRGRIDVKKVIDYKIFVSVFMPEDAEDEEQPGSAKEGEGDEVDDEETESENEEEDDNSDDSLDGFIVDDDEVDENDVETESETEAGDAVDDSLKGEEDVEERRKSSGASARKKGKEPLARSSGKRTATGAEKTKSSGKKGKKGKEPKKKNHYKKLTLPALKALASRNQAAKREYYERLRVDFVSSAKLDKTMALLKTIMEETDEKTIIFSQWTSLLDLLEIPIVEQRWHFRRYDGSMKADDRSDAVFEFTDSRNCRIMLVSLKAGNAGLNLTSASQVIILDPFWNPYIEEQAIDRAHRIGQKRPVRVHRVLTEGTVEDRIVELQEKKRELISTALDESAASNIARLGVQELAYLFGVNPRA